MSGQRSLNPLWWLNFISLHGSNGYLALMTLHLKGKFSFYWFVEESSKNILTYILRQK